MQDLRFIGVHEDGLHLLLADDEGNRYSVPIDEPLRTAARRERPRTFSTDAETGAQMRPKDVQALIRAGVGADEVAERAGWSVDKVRRYEGPIIAEREYVAGLARQVRLRPRGAGAGGPAPTLEARVTERMRARELDPGTAVWDSFRSPTGRWSVLVLFVAGGRQRQAVWGFDPLARTVSATDDEARWLSEDDDVQAPGPIPAPHLQAPSRPSQVYDVEAEGGVAARPKRRRAEPVDLMAAMRERSSARGRRRRGSKASDAPGLDAAPDEALPLEELSVRVEDAGLPPAAHGATEDDDERRSAEGAPAGDAAPEPTLDDAVDDLADDGSDDGSGDTVDDGWDDADTEVAEAAGTGATASDRAATSTASPSRYDQPLPLDDFEDAKDAGDAGDADTPAGSEQTAPLPVAHDDDRDDDRADDPEVGPPVDDILGDPGSSAPQSPSRDVEAEGVEAAHPDEADDVGERDTGSVTATEPEAPAEPAPARPTPPKRPASGRKGRPSVPSWDDIMFGRKGD
jgi:hypothetical protein